MLWENITGKVLEDTIWKDLNEFDIKVDKSDLEFLEENFKKKVAGQLEKRITV